VLVCPGCYPTALGDLTRCSRCDSVRLVRRLDQVECLNCHLTRDVDSEPPVPAPRGTAAGGTASRGTDAGLAAEVASALARILGTQ
jgi:hypothetical protein